MDFSKLSSSERTAAVAALVVAVTAVLSLYYDWGLLMAVSLVAGLGALAVIFGPQMSATMSLPGSKGSLLTALGVIAVAATIISGIPWIDWLTRHLVTLDAIQYLIGLVAAVVLAYTGWQMLRAEGGKFRIGTSA
jgi:threonine/homoserine/homoserine lactone efflux protein